jgi:putative ABC transport system permease protein
MDEMFGYFVAILGLLAGTIAVGVVYNSARIALAERDRELATLRVIGFTRWEAFRIIVEELAIQVLLAIPIGFLLGRLFAVLLSHALATELFRLPAVLEPSSYGAAALLVLAALGAVALVVWRWMGRLDLVAVLKTRE